MRNNRRVDQLLECLVFLAKYYQKNVSRDSMVSGIILEENMMNVESFVQSGKRIGLATKIVTRGIENFSPLVLPVVLLLQSNRACVLLGVDKEQQQAIVSLPGVPGETAMPLDKLNSEYTGQGILIKAEYNFKNKVSKKLDIPNPREWFSGTLKRNIPIYSKVFLMATMINLFVIVIPLFTMNVYDRVLPNNGIETLWVLAIGAMLVLVFDFILKLMRSHYLGIAGKRADIIMSSKIFDHLLNIRLDQKPASTGMFLSRLQSFESVRDFFTTATITALVDIPFIVIFIFLIFYIGGMIGWVSILTLVVSILFSLIMQRPIRKIMEKSAKEEQLKMTTLNETAASLEIIKTTHAQNRMKQHWEQALNQTSYFNEKMQHLSQTVSYFTSFIAQFSSIAIIIVGVYLTTDNEMTMGAIIAAMMLNSRVISPVSQIVGMILRYDRAMVSLKNIDELMAMNVERDDTVYLGRPNLSGDIVFKDITFAYKDQNNDALKNINLTIKEGERVAIIGKIGSGKSTLSKLLLNLYVPQKGSILVDNTDVRQIDPVDLRHSIGYVHQEPYLFLGSIRDNITIGEKYATDEEIIEAAEIAGVHEFLGKHEAGYDLMVGERGEGLSGGERQSVTLARTLISKPNILILDEPTNAMDMQTEDKFIRNLQNVVQGRTLIVMTHKMSLLALVDRLIVLHEGEVVADGPKNDVLKSLKNGG
jgi:ATP-binding cassette subfamily C protein LapB